MLHAAAENLEVTPRTGAATDSRTGVASGTVYGPLRSTLILLSDGAKSLCLLSAPFYVDVYPISNLIRAGLGQILGLRREEIVVFSTHNHSCVMLTDSWPFPDGFPQEDELVTVEH